MRVSTSLINYNNTNSILQKQTDMFYTSQQLGTGKRVLTPSDDPVASTLAFNAKNKLANIEQYGKNIDYAEKSLQISESTLDTIHNRLQRVRQLMIQANNDTLGDDGRKTIGLEIREITDQLEKLVNTKDEQGNYIFSGSKVDTAPFAKQADGSYEYQGDDQERSVQISDSVRSPLNMTGKEIFEDIESALFANSPVSSYPDAANASGADFAVAGTQAFLKGSQIGDYQIEITAVGAAAGAPPEYPVTINVTDPTGTPIITGGTLADLENHLNSGADASVGNLDLSIPANPGPPADPTPVAGESFTLRVNNEKQDMLTGMQRLAETLEDFTGAEKDTDMLAASLNDIDSWLNSVEVARTEHGTRRNSIDAIGGNNVSVELYLKEQVSNLEDLDYAEAIGRFVLEQTALQASQQTFSKTASMSLFNYIS
ncbi:flagellar hook-associated protein FlgL [Oceanospirillum linum]|uniref:Flagellar hook-associated protein 3 n=1 Tax=Oceanospirillum linum TaxID=966 RepID=A0A1T1HFH4_OCELI|nr:flagellar hook-associated protein FlgL [Oceanospirillum linum]OOV88601.1 flagellar hook-associated protein 3 [Oceanospirillum linum]SEG05975.1 flagellar hook-associated protein 3 FlgL [Oleiphilus messinensis]SMP20682.1 flagellar hook-associated protein 3 FlgL [Oceanospirillum linum]